MEVISFQEHTYPEFQAKGFASQFAIPFAKHICKGFGYDIGCNRIEWMYPGAIPIDPNFQLPNTDLPLPVEVCMKAWKPEHDAYNLPDVGQVDYIFSSHCLEHLPNWVEALDYWISHIKPNGNLFLYLPDFSQHYWRPWNNRKHIHAFTPEIIGAYLRSRKDLNLVFVSGVDLNNSFIATAQKIYR